MRFPRSSGILLHPTSLPSQFGIGDLGDGASRFVDFLAAAGQKLWQVLPLGPTGYGDSPYQSFSAFAGNPLLISLEKLVQEGFLSAEDLENLPFPEHSVDYGWVIGFKYKKLRIVFENFKKKASQKQREDFDAFRQRNDAWLDDFALFMALKEAFAGKPWTQWEADAAARKPSAMQHWREKIYDEIQARKFWQYLFFQQWASIKQYAGDRGIKIIGDIPIYTAHDSADVWAHPDLYQLDEKGIPAAVAGVPPDYFSETGQLWGNPIYRWDRLRETGYRWWIDRFHAALKLVDIVRLDHFRGFEAYWEVPGGAETAIHGRWVKGPGADFFATLNKALGELPIIAENLGLITKEVENLRLQFDLPGMSILQFAFASGPSNPALPHQYVHNLAAYSGTHDNDTIVGWWNSGGEGDSTRSREEVEKEKHYARLYLGTDGREIHWTIIRALMASTADMAIFPLQDVLGLGAEARMNMPGRPAGNWQWRFTPEMLTEEIHWRLRELTEIYGR
ncbi:MAG: 4-alpha-glucanotransferase [Candidatus Omnitrophota bacterium]